jgi:hypothetical protein
MGKEEHTCVGVHVLLCIAGFNMCGVVIEGPAGDAGHSTGAPSRLAVQVGIPRRVDQKGTNQHRLTGTNRPEGMFEVI